LEFAKDYEMLGSEELGYLSVDEAFDKAKTLFTDFGNVKALSECKGLSVLADSLLRQVFYNLIHNSLRHGQKVTQIKVCSGRDQGSLTLFYEDDGVGISPEDRENLFKEGHGKGTGYGLYLIHRIMEFYGWKIQEEGEYGKGVRFAMIIPETNVQGKKNYFLE
jgi:signal transduction histidine kinase